MRKLNPKTVLRVGIAGIVILLLIALSPFIVARFMGPGVKTEPLNLSNIEPATTDINGMWRVVKGGEPNQTSVGFTFEELLPSDRRTTSASTQEVDGTVTIENNTMTGAEILVDMTTLVSDKEVRDENVRRKLFDTDRHPQAAFHLTSPVDVSQIADDGSVSTVALAGDLTIKGTTKHITADFDAVRDADRVIVYGEPTINRNDFNVISPEFIAAKIADEGELNIRLFLAKTQ